MATQLERLPITVKGKCLPQVYFNLPQKQGIGKYVYEFLYTG